ncbi:phytanoyl-CoA dioxygenase family protein [Rubrivivax gelatinosus]|uniref:phytanoyl-CoA dioxygenase family protein n=1 Tax=Rubrivivax gelatinosus TaxID=28068 RepID=UPI00031BD134|nr:phytanoyl-CoA dioxygenase family protein [Rubrivivax gelatinosus]MBG6082454.1 ectoine hydroxylase-related dioxygenase (phytanoyl-CoA dioxygenase family) [Rubrivivax gelatinosus]
MTDATSSIALRQAHDFYQQHGWYVHDVFSQDDLDELEYHIERFYSGEHDRPLDVLLSRDWTPEKGNVMRQNDYISLRMDAVREALHRSAIGRIAAALAGTHAIRLFHDQLICKPPSAPATAVGWHTDKAYWATCSSDLMITAWIPLQDCPEEIGPLVVVDGSHRWPGSAEAKTFHTQDMASVQPQVRAAFQTARKVPMALKRGQVSFHHCLALHGSYPNKTDRTRLSLSVHLQDSSNRYRRVRGEGGAEAVHQNDMLCRRDADGAPDYTDPHVFPVLWPHEVNAAIDVPSM